MSARLLTPAATAILLVAGFLALTSIRPARSDGAPSHQSIDRIIGNGGFNVVHPLTPGPGEQESLVARLSYIENLLRTRDVSAWPERLRAERERNLDHLHDYRLRGIFPVNEAYPNEIRPCFIDRQGAICAVGYLIEQSAGRDFAEWINRRYQYTTVAEMDSPALQAWIARSGLTPAEVRTIQEPGFRGRIMDIEDRFTRTPIFAATDSATHARMAAAQITSIHEQIDSGRVARWQARLDTATAARW